MSSIREMLVVRVSRNGLLVFVLVLTIAAICGGLFFRAQAESVLVSYLFERELKKVDTCTRDTGSVIACARPHVKRLMELRSAPEVLAAFARRLPSIRCHYVGHIVGQELYRLYQDDERAFGQCSAVCESACAHGAVAESFVTSAGLDAESLDLVHVSVEELQATGARLCTSGSCHGVGHAFFLAYGEFGPALERCHEVGDGIRGIECTRGVFMEYSNQLTARSVWREGPDLVALESQFGLCADVPRQADREACYYYLPGLILGALQREKGELLEDVKIRTMQGICDSMPSADRLLCISGVGVHFYSYLLLGSPEASRICEGFTEPQERAACAFGMLSMAAEGGSNEQKAEYCSAFSTDPVRQSCFQSLFYIKALRDKAVSAEELCKGSGVCLAASRQATYDPFDYIPTFVR